MRLSDNFWNRQFARNLFLWGGLLLLAQWSVFAGQSVVLTWNPSPDTNVAGYKIYYGGASLTYTNSVLLGNVTHVTISGLTAGATYYFAATTVDAAGDESKFSNEAIYSIPLADSNPPPLVANPPAAVVPPPVVNVPPTLNGLTNLTLYQNAGMQTVWLTSITTGATNQNLPLTVSAVSSNLKIITAPAVNYNSPNNSGTVTFAPVTNALGTATVIVTVNNGGPTNNSTTQAFTVTVLPVPVVNPPPTLNPIANVTVSQNVGVQLITLTGITSGSATKNQALTVRASSSNLALVPTPMIRYSSPTSMAQLGFSPVANAFGVATITVTVNDGGKTNNFVQQTFTVTVLPNQPPTLNPIANVTVGQNTGVQIIPLTGITSGSPTERQVLTVRSYSSNPALVPAPMILYFSPANTAQLAVRPLANASGVATITVTVNDGGKTNNLVQQTFTVTVLPNQPPTLNPIANVTVGQNTGTQIIPLTGITFGSPTENQVLTVRATSSNPALVPTPAIRYFSPANTAQLAIRPQANVTGVATITVTVNDGGKTNNVIQRSFTVTVASPVSPSVSTSAAQANVLASTNQAALLAAVASPRGQFSFRVTGVPGGQYVVQATSDLIHWTSVQTNTAPFTFQDPTASGSSQRFYRTYYVQ